MPPSRSRLERDDPPPRRKSCHACVKAKRRCDQGQPACTRCTQRSIACHYRSRPARSQASPADSLPATPTAFDSGIVLNCANTDETFADFLVPSYNSEPLNHAWTSQKSPWVYPSRQPWSPPAAPVQSTQGAEATSLELALDDRDPLGDGTIDADLFFDFTDNTPVGKDVAARPPPGIPPPSRCGVASLHIAFETNFSYAVDRIRAAPSNMLQENQTPWCHPLLYRVNMPRVIQGKNHQYLMLYLDTRIPNQKSYSPFKAMWLILTLQKLSPRAHCTHPRTQSTHGSSCAA